MYFVVYQNCKKQVTENQTDVKEKEDHKASAACISRSALLSTTVKEGSKLKATTNSMYVHVVITLTFTMIEL